MISLDISTLSEPLGWAFTLIGGMPPCFDVQNSMQKAAKTWSVVPMYNPCFDVQNSMQKCLYLTPYCIGIYIYHL